MNAGNITGPLILITSSTCPHVCVLIRWNAHVHVVGACKKRVHAWGPVPPRAMWHNRDTAHTNNTRMCIDKHTHTHTPLCIHITVFVSTTTSTRTPRVTCCCAIAVALPCTISTRCNGWCDIPAERGSDTGDHVQSVDLLHVGVTKQLGPEHGADHNGCKHRALVRCLVKIASLWLLSIWMWIIFTTNE